MVSFHTSLSPNTRQTIREFDDVSKKRKREVPQGDDTQATEAEKSILDVVPHPKTPLPLEWQRCLDMQSGQIHFYNSRTNQRTCKDPRTAQKQSSPGHMSLDLELNLPSHSLGMDQAGDSFTSSRRNSQTPQDPNGGMDKNEASGALTRCPSWLACEEDNQEMVAAVCTRCHMLVMLCKSSPLCPNCKFMHPPDQSPPSLFKRRCSIFC